MLHEYEWCTRWVHETEWCTRWMLEYTVHLDSTFLGVHLDSRF